MACRVGHRPLAGRRGAPGGDDGEGIRLGRGPGGGGDHNSGFGGIAITWEHVSHLRLRRTLLDRRLFGDEMVHYEAIAALRLANRELA